MGQTDTKQRIISVAERLFAEKGFAATSIREVVAEAKVNLAAVHYHFGSKEALFFEILNRRLGPAEAERLRRLEEARDGSSGRPSVEKVVEAFLRPVADLIESQPDAVQFSKLLGRTFTESPDLAGKLRQRFFGRTTEAFLPALQEALPHLSPEDICWQYHFMISAMSGALGQPTRLAFISSGKVKGDDPTEMIDRLIRFVCSGIQASAAGGKGGGDG